MDEIGVGLPDSVRNQAHRVGKVISQANDSSHITLWRHRTMVYKARKNSNRYKTAIGIRLN